MPYIVVEFESQTSRCCGCYAGPHEQKTQPERRPAFPKLPVKPRERNEPRSSRRRHFAVKSGIPQQYGCNGRRKPDEREDRNLAQSRKRREQERAITDERSGYANDDSGQHAFEALIGIMRIGVEILAEILEAIVDGNADKADAEQQGD